MINRIYIWTLFFIFLWSNDDIYLKIRDTYSSSQTFLVWTTLIRNPCISTCSDWSNPIWMQKQSSIRTKPDKWPGRQFTGPTSWFFPILITVLLTIQNLMGSVFIYLLDILSAILFGSSIFSWPLLENHFPSVIYPLIILVFKIMDWTICSLCYW